MGTGRTGPNVLCAYMPKSNEDKKRIERWFVQAARRASAIIPDGVIYDFEKPDFKLASPDGLIGIEVTELLRKDNTGPFPPVAEATLHEQAVEAAEEYYRKSGAIPVRVIVYFTNDWKSYRRPQDLGRSLCDFVASHNKHLDTYTKRDVPDDFDVVGINPPDGQPWLCGGSANLGPLQQTELALAIRDKEKRLPLYRDNLPGAPIWLMVYISVTTSRTVALPFDASTWKFESAFDKIVLFNYPEGEVIDIGAARVSIS